LADIDTDARTETTQRAPAEEDVRICLFSISGDAYAVMVDALAEIIIPQKIFSVPTTPSHVIGVINLDTVGRLGDQRRRVDRVSVVRAQRLDHVGAPALLEHARLLAHHLERRPHAKAGEQLRQPLRRLVVLRKDVVLRVEPQRHQHGHCLRRHRREEDGRRRRTPTRHVSQRKNQQRAVPHQARVRQPAVRRPSQ